MLYIQDAEAEADGVEVEDAKLLGRHEGLLLLHF